MKKMSKKKMMTGGMANPNAKAVAAKVATGRSGGGNASATAQSTPGSKGVTPNMNPKATVAPTAMYGGKMKMGGKMSYGGKVSMKKMGKKK